MSKPLILISNDDGITANGIKHLVNLVKDFAEVVVVAPDSPQSGMGHAITIGDSLRLDSVQVFEGIESYQVSGTPADCVKIAKHHILHDRRPDLVLSGINHGANSSINVLYSGTMSAAIEGAIEGLPSIGFSLCDYNHDADMNFCNDFILEIIHKALKNGLPKGVALNVNFPVENLEPIKGIKYCRQAKAKWEEEFEERLDPYKRKYYWMAGEFVNQDEGTDTDIWALNNNYVSVVPCQYDLTDYPVLSELQNTWN